MFAVLSCLQDQHDLRLVMVAGLICIVASTTGVWAYSRGLAASKHGRRVWLSAAGFVAGAGVWATHFVGMLAYQTSLSVGYAPVGTVASLLVAMIAFGAGFAVAAWAGGVFGRSVGGLVCGVGVASMHFLGIAAMQLPASVAWDHRLAAIAVAIGALGCAAALVALGDGRKRRRRAVAAGILVLSICGLHFTAMGAVTLTPLGVLSSAETLGRDVLAILVCALAAAIVATAIGIIWMESFSQVRTLRSLRAALDAVPAGLAFFDRAERLIICNAAYAEQIGRFGVQPIPGTPHRELIGAAVAGLSAPDEAVERVASADFSSEIQWPDGRWMRVEVGRTQDGGTASILTDITAETQAAATLAAARDAAEAASRAKSAFLANMSHEIRTPLNGVLAVADLLSGTDLSARQAQLVSVIRDSGATLDGLLADVLDLACIEAGTVTLQTQRFGLADMVRQTAAPFADQALAKGLRLVVEAAPDAEAEVVGDAGRLRQVLANLLSNAVKFTEHGVVSVCVGSTGDGRWRLEVRDTGAGFDMADKDRLFARFGQADGSDTRRFGGAGLGLSLCAETTALLGGEISCHSTPGLGATFVVVVPLPLAEDRAPAELEARRPDERPRVLIVDDNAVNRQVLELILESAGGEWVSVENGRDAVEAYETARFDAVLMDIQMPIMDGLEATRRIRSWERRQGRPATPIIMVSASTLAEHVDASRAAGADAHLAKPVSATAVLSALEQAIELQRAAA